MFNNFTIDGIDYYRYEGKFYADNTVIREVISEKEYRNKMMDYLIAQ